MKKSALVVFLLLLPFAFAHKELGVSFVELVGQNNTVAKVAQNTSVDGNTFQVLFSVNDLTRSPTYRYSCHAVVEGANPSDDCFEGLCYQGNARIFQASDKSRLFNLTITLPNGTQKFGVVCIPSSYVVLAVNSSGFSDSDSRVINGKNIPIYAGDFINLTGTESQLYKAHISDKLGIKSFSSDWVNVSKSSVVDTLPLYTQDDSLYKVRTSIFEFNISLVKPPLNNTMIYRAHGNLTLLVLDVNPPKPVIEVVSVNVSAEVNASEESNISVEQNASSQVSREVNETPVEPKITGRASRPLPDLPKKKSSLPLIIGIIAAIIVVIIFGVVLFLKFTPPKKPEKPTFGF